MPKTFTDDEAEYMTQSATHHWLSIDCWTCELRSDKKQLPTTMQCRSHSRRRTSECLFVTACSMDEYAEEKRTEKNLIGISAAETTNNKKLRSTFCITAIQTRNIARPLCDSRASCYITYNEQEAQLSLTNRTCRFVKLLRYFKTFCQNT